METFLPLIAALLGIGAIVYWRQRASHPSYPSGAKLPPGPSGKPLIGNLLDIPQKHSWLKFKEWADLYGQLFRMNIAGWEHYVVSSEKVANDLFRDRGTNYSSRGGLPAAAELVCGNLAPVFLPYNDRWRRGRRLMHHLTTKSGYQDVQAFESVRLLHDLLKSPEDYEAAFERYAGAVIFRLTSAKRVETGKEDHARRALKAVHDIERVATPGAYLVDIFPSLMALPKFVAPFKRELAMLWDAGNGLFMELQEDTRKEMASGKGMPCWQGTFLEEKDKYGLSDQEGAWVVGTMFGAGSGTTASAMMSFVLAMVHHPQWQKRVQDEVDEQVGNDRMPEFSDMPKLPTVRAFVKEVLRWRPVTAGGIPHMSVEDDVYEGLFIPAGTNVHPNQWAIHRDPTLYPDPETFNPARWLEPQYPTFREPLTVYPNLQNFSAFGFGRRICPGLSIAESSLNLAAARIAWACDISKRVDVRTGKEIEVPVYDYTAGFNTQPKWFPFELKARNEKKREVVERVLEQNRKNDPLLGR